MTTLRVLSFCLALVCWHSPLAAADLAMPRIEVYKAKRELRLFDGTQLVKSYHVALGANPVAPKEQEGDQATPEGTYFVCLKNPQSKFHLSLAISYPGPADAERGLKAGLISAVEYQAILQTAADQQPPPWKTRLGGEVFVHGGGSSSDWTWGCIALSDTDIEELFALVPVKTPITIYP